MTFLACYPCLALFSGFNGSSLHVIVMRVNGAMANGIQVEECQLIIQCQCNTSSVT